MFNQFFNNPNDTTTPQEEDYKWEEHHLIQEMKTEIKELQEENAWLRYSLEKYGIDPDDLKKAA